MLITTCQAENTFEITRLLADYLAERLHTQVTCVENISWERRYLRIDRGMIDIGWICGRPYTKRTDRPNPRIELLAAPVMQSERYCGQPVYFSDVVVHADSPFQQFADLRGASWAFNDIGSHSGYAVTCFHLAQIGELHPFFGKAVASGGHMNSLQMVLDKKVDASAIDSTVLDWALQKRPFLTPHLRIIDTLGPSPIPPLVIQKDLPSDLKQAIRHLLLHMHEDENGRLILNSGQLARFVRV
ncbi:MAG: PhnD/SsuA/transferrin family substrate-binding protein, partial [Anaerolineales bacterium]|nr:PhnD/SsuA/transferrin family substrate-binding protein [Anaerolineales bacterium]